MPHPISRAQKAGRTPIVSTDTPSDVATTSVELEETHTPGVLGINDGNLRTLSELVGVDSFARGNIVRLVGPAHKIMRANRALMEMQSMVRRGHPVTPDAVRHIVNLVAAETPETVEESLRNEITVHRGKVIRPKTAGQKRYVDAIDENTIVFGIGPAGSGKTYLAMAKAVQALQSKNVSRIILTRPAVEAGEKLGFLPGTLNEKIDPYLRPLHDALREMVDPDTIPKLMESGVVEVAPLAYMRGRTLSDSFVILDEAQNTTPEQMKMFLTRLGFGSKIVVTGDITQVDLPGGQHSGLKKVRNILRGVPDVHFEELGSEDVVRHQLVSRIVDAYAAYDMKEEARRGTHREKENHK